MLGYSGPSTSLFYPELSAPVLISLIQLSLLSSTRARAEPCSHHPGHLQPPFVHFFPREPPQQCSAPPRPLLEPSPAGIDGPTADRYGSAARAPPLCVDPLLRSSSTQIDHGNGFLVSSSSFPTPFSALSPPLRAPHAAIHHGCTRLATV